ncbi:hypothetical protein GCM10008932_03100 [Alkalibacterium iburiense]|uniref:Uncharacterized protein n=1 Tax=Alkalibacterium iburiense TaxID=290589 RepID=A0ABN0X2F4_9LACT
MITLNRQTGFIGVGLSMTIKVDDEKVESILENHTREVELNRDKATIRVTQLGIKSNEIEVSGGEHLILKMRPWVKYAIILLLLSVLLISLISFPWSFTNELLAYILIFAAYLGAFFSLTLMI